MAPQTKEPSIQITKQQLGLHQEFLRLGSLLMAQNINLFHQALTQLSAKHNLAVVTPATSISDILPPSRIARSKPSTTHTVYRKYSLPRELAAKEFYQCMTCKERRATNTFAADHTHPAPHKTTIRWYCPVCDSFFAVTHRGYHVKNRHADLCTEGQAQQPDQQQQQQQAQARPHQVFKRQREQDEEEEQQHLLPIAKLARFSPSATPSVETISDQQASPLLTPTPEMYSVETSYPTDEPQEPLFFDEGSMMAGVLFPQDQQDSQYPLLGGFDDLLPTEASDQSF